MGILIAIHVIVCLLLVIIILIQRGRGAGLVESFSGVESIFGTKTNAFLTRTTAILSIFFFLTCLSLAFFSAKQSRSLMKDIKIEQEAPQKEVPETITQEAPKQQETPTEQTPAQEAPTPE